MFTNKQIWQIAMRQSAADINCKETDFLKKENVIVKLSRTAIKSGFIPAWVEMTVKPVEIVDKMNFVNRDI